ncbi:MFS transporter [Gemmata sp. JC717]|uniref:MFS transporter n=1 Tax=Gemmata algarum TaxID=2975278 RepID=UPI0021BB36E2|nr:MFS transporter [Gemmata algarum]MDY3555477.1 MFS transporter [Gemmata algarum]
MDRERLEPDAHAWTGTEGRSAPDPVPGWRNRGALHSAYFLGMTGIGFCLPYLPLYLKEEKGFSDRGIALVWVLAAVAGLVQFPVGLWSDRVGVRKPFLVVALAVLAVATALLPAAGPTGAGGAVLIGLLVVLFAENGPCRATVESMAGAEATRLAPPGGVGAALGALRLWRPVAVVLTALVGGAVVEERGIGWLLGPLAVVQALAVGAALLIREGGRKLEPTVEVPARRADARRNDPVLWAFVAAMVLFHVANAPPGAYLGLFLKNDLGAPARDLSYAFVVSMIAWTACVRPVGRLADRIGRKPLLVAGWAVMALRLVLLALAREGWQVLAIQVLDGLAQGLFAVAAAAWVTDRLGGARRAGEAQVLVGSALVVGSAVGPALAGLVVTDLGYRGTFGLLAGVGCIATLVVALAVPREVHCGGRHGEGA